MSTATESDVDRDVEASSPRDVPALSQLCADIDAFLAKPKGQAVGDTAFDLIRLCGRAGVDQGENDDAEALRNRLKDRRYELGEALETMRTLLADIDALGLKPSTYLMDPECRTEVESLCRRAGVDFSDESEAWQMGQWLAEAAHELRGGIPGDDEDRLAEATADPEAEAKAAKDAEKLARYQREWEERTAWVKEKLVSLDLAIHEIDCEIAPLNTQKRGLNKEKNKLLVEYGYRKAQGVPTELPAPGSGVQGSLDFGDTEDDGPSLQWEDQSEEVGYFMLVAESSARDQVEREYWRITYVGGAYCLHESDKTLDPPGESQAFGDEELAKAEAETLERAIARAEKAKSAETDPRRLAIRLERIGVPKGILAKLADAAIETIGDVAALTALGRQLDSVPGIGPEKAAEIADAIGAFGREYANDPDVAIAKYGG